MIHIQPECYFLGALLLLILPFPWILAAFLAAVFHESCHILMVLLLGGSVQEIRVTASGAVIESQVDRKETELLCTLAGPVGSLGLFLFCRIWPRLALCGLIQGVFNLLPIYPLDGGRILRSTLELMVKQYADRLMHYIEVITLSGVFAFSLAAAVRYSLGVMPVLVVLMMILKGIMRKRPCKAGRIGVQ